MILTIFFLLASGLEAHYTFPASAEFGGIKPEIRCYEAALAAADSGLMEEDKVPLDSPYRCTESYLM